MRDIDNENIQNDLDAVDGATSELDEAGRPTGFDIEENSNKIETPYDPEKISISTITVPIDTLFRKYSEKDIHITPAFQRNFVWDKTRQSRLIESLILSIPLPMFYLSEDRDGTWSVIDGLQRLTTILHFIIGKDYRDIVAVDDLEKTIIKGDGFKLINLEYCKEDCEGKTFAKLPLHIRKRILKSQFVFTIVNPQTPPNVKFNIFHRINTGGLPLSSQEIRHAMYQGVATKLLEELSKTEYFKKATDSSVNDERMAARELILRFLSFLIRDKGSFDNTLPQLGELLNMTMIIINSMPSFEIPLEYNNYINNKIIETIVLNDIEKIKILFKTAMERAYALFGNRAFRKSIDKTKRRTPLNKSMFDVLSVKLAFMDSDDFTLLEKNKDEFLSLLDFIINENKSTELAFGASSSQQAGIILRFNAIDLITEVSLRKTISKKFEKIPELGAIINYVVQDNS